MFDFSGSSRMDCKKRIAVFNAYRKLWVQHVMWTRFFIISTVLDLGDLQFVTQRLLRNPQDFAKELQKFYSAEKANQFEQLLTDHLKIAAQLVSEDKAGNTAAAAVTREKWYQNADAIAEFLASINPYWRKKKWQSMLYEHLKLTEQEASLYLNGRYSQSIDLIDQIEAQAYEMADVMAEGIIKQFYL